MEVKGGMGLPRGLSGKESACNAGDAGGVGSIPALGRSPGEGNGNPLQYSCLGNPMDREARWATVHGVAKRQTTLKRLSRHAQRERIQAGGSIRAGGAGATGRRGLRKLSPSGKSTLPERGYPIQLTHADSCKPARSRGRAAPLGPSFPPLPHLGSGRTESSEGPLLWLLRSQSSPPPHANTHTICPRTSGRSPQPSPTAPPHLWTPGRP